MKKIVLAIILVLASLSINGCSSGKDVEVKQVKKIRKGRTTEKQIRKIFGEPTATNLDYKRGRKTLTYGYVNSDGTNKMLAGAGGAAATILLGPVGLVGGYLLANNVEDRAENKTLDVVISTRTHRVVDYNYRVTQGRTSGLGLGGSIGGL